MSDLTRVNRPGKFEGELAITEFAHQQSLDGADDEVGDVTEDGEACVLVRGPWRDPQELEVARSAYGLSSEDLEQLRHSAGAILTEDSQGFVRGEWHVSEEALERAWNRIERAFTAEEDPDEEDRK